MTFLYRNIMQHYMILWFFHSPLMGDTIEKNIQPDVPRYNVYKQLRSMIFKRSGKIYTISIVSFLPVFILYPIELIPDCTGYFQLKKPILFDFPITSFICCFNKSRLKLHNEDTMLLIASCFNVRLLVIENDLFTSSTKN